MASSHKKSSSLNRRQSLIILLVMLILLFQRLVVALPEADSVVWVINDACRAASFAALAALCASLIPYHRLAEKCCAGAVVAYSMADLLICLMHYVITPVAYLVASAIYASAFCAGFIFYHFRSYRIASEPIRNDSISCLRKRPDSLQGLLISMCGAFGADAEYAIYCRGYVYRFRKGFLVKEPYSAIQHGKYHCTAGKFAHADDVLALNKLVGLKWGLFGHNCLTTLARFWKEHGRK